MLKKSEKLFLLTSILAIMTTSYAYADTMMDDHMSNNSTMKHSVMSTPMYQIKHGTSMHDVKCNGGLSLIFKAANGSPVCVKPSTASLLIARGWAQGDMMKMNNHVMANMNQSMNSQDMMNQTMTNESMKQDKEMAMNKMENNSMNDKNMMIKPSVDESKYSDAPALVGISDYINTTPAKLAQDMKNRVIVYDFWTFNCINCIHTLPHVVDLSNKYLGKALVIGVHSPETVFEKDLNNVRDAVHKYNIQYPVVTDNEFQTWNAFGNHYWPHVYIADSHGKIRYDHIGEGSYDEIDKTVQSLLLEQSSEKPKELVMG